MARIVQKFGGSSVANAERIFRVAKIITDAYAKGNEMCVVEATGQQILDALEMGARNAPGECGGFLQVSGMSYEIDLNVEPTVEVSDNS